MYTQIEKLKENKNRVVANSVAQRKKDKKPKGAVLGNQPECIAQCKLQKMTNDSPLIKQTIQLKVITNSHIKNQQTSIQRKESHVIQKITEEDARQARFRFSTRATAHGYTQEQLQTIMQHRFAEITVGEGQSMLIGQGTEEGRGVYGQILYNCTLNNNGIYDIFVFHAHGQGRMG